MLKKKELFIIIKINIDIRKSLMKTLISRVALYEVES